MNYYKRTADTLLQDMLDAFGAVLIEGPKWCGKTTTATQLAKSIIKMIMIKQYPCIIAMNRESMLSIFQGFLCG